MATTGRKWVKVDTGVVPVSRTVFSYLPFPFVLLFHDSALVVAFGSLGVGEVETIFAYALVRSAPEAQPWYVLTLKHSKGKDLQPLLQCASIETERQKKKNKTTYVLSVLVV